MDNIQFHKTFRFFNVLLIFFLTTSETMHNYSSTYKYGIYGLPHELPKDLIHTILGNNRKALKPHRIIVQSPVPQPKSKFC